MSPSSPSPSSSCAASYLMDAGDRADLVDLVQEDDAGLRAVHVVVGVLRKKKSEWVRHR